jgi:hypothetical protein
MEQRIYAYLRQTQPANPTQPQTAQMQPLAVSLKDDTYEHRQI